MSVTSDLQHYNKILELYLRYLAGDDNVKFPQLEAALEAAVRDKGVDHQQAMDHLKNDGPKPKYWPFDEFLDVVGVRECKGTVTVYNPTLPSKIKDNQ